MTTTEHKPYRGTTAQLLQKLKVGARVTGVGIKQAMAIYTSGRNCGMMISRQRQNDGTFLITRLR